MGLVSQIYFSQAAHGLKQVNRVKIDTGERVVKSTKIEDDKRSKNCVKKVNKKTQKNAPKKLPKMTFDVWVGISLVFRDKNHPHFAAASLNRNRVTFDQVRRRVFLACTRKTLRGSLAQELTEELRRRGYAGWTVGRDKENSGAHHWTTKNAKNRGK